MSETLSVFCSSLENLHAIVEGVSHDDAPVAVDGDAAIWAAELPVACPLAAQGANMGPIAVAKHLHAMVVLLNNNNVAGGIKRDASGTQELTCSRSSAADGADVGAVAQPMHLHTSVAAVENSNVALAVDGNTPGM